MNDGQSEQNQFKIAGRENGTDTTLRTPKNCPNNGVHPKDPARYFTTLLQKRLPAVSPESERQQTFRVKKVDNEQGGRTSQRHDNGAPLDRAKENQNSYLSPSPMELFEELKPAEVAPGELTDEKFMEAYSKNSIPWVTFIGPAFFTLFTNIAKSDAITAKIRTLDGQVIIVPMIRGKISPDDRERGVLNVEHGRILGALESIWVQQGGPYLGWRRFFRLRWRLL